MIDPQVRQTAIDQMTQVLQLAVPDANPADCQGAAAYLVDQQIKGRGSNGQQD